ncbi:hypothetical protein K440DRAFT_660411 [Wilcoxina mikolae CBS 423.85]|nr:hypothetical protein K440DRAFT_660411 [Wilcoxina mikolae CBS 423.85]
MSVSELQGALATKPESKSIKDTSNNMAVLNKHTITRLAGSVLEVINDDVRFIHKSAKDFLVESRYFQNLDVGSKPEMHLGKVCLRYLSFKSPKNRIDDWSMSEGWLNPFFEYAAFNWYHHFPHDDDDEIRYMVERARGFRKTKTDLLHGATEKHPELEQDNNCPRVTMRSCVSSGTIISTMNVPGNMNVARVLCVEKCLLVNGNLNLSESGGLCVGISLHVNETLNLAGGGLYVGISLHMNETLNLAGGELYVGNSLHVNETLNLADGGLYVGNSLHVNETLNLAGGRLYVDDSLHVSEALNLVNGRLYVGDSLHVSGTLNLAGGGLYVGGTLHLSGNLNLAGGSLYVGGSLHVSGCLNVDGGWLYVTTKYS